MISFPLFWSFEFATGTGEIIWIGTYFLPFLVTGWNIRIGVVLVCAWDSYFYNLLRFRRCRRRVWGIHNWSQVGRWSVFGFRICLLVVSAGANKKSSNSFALIGHIPVFLKPLWAFAMVAAFPYAAEKMNWSGTV